MILAIRKHARHWALLGVLTALIACSDDDYSSTDSTADTPPPPPEPGTVVEVATEDGSFTTLLQAVDAAGLSDALSDENATLTVFAPTDDAFALLPEGALDALLADTDSLTDVLNYHVLDSIVDAEAAAAAAGTTVETALGTPIAITDREGQLYINEAKLVTVDIEASNGVIHVIDAVLSPPDLTPSELTIAEIASANENLSTLVAAATAANLVGVLSDPEASITVLAPTDEAFAVLGQTTIDALLLDIDRLTNLLTYHVIDTGALSSIDVTAAYGKEITMANGDTAAVDIVEGMLKINGSTIIMKDIVASNGIVHVIDAVLAPPSAGVGTMLEVAAADGSFKTLISAVDAAGLTAELLDPEADATLFAPTDDAFAAVDSTVLDALLADQEALINVLTYHALAGQVDSATAISLDGSDIRMANDDLATLTVRDGDLYINEAKVVVADIPANNGIIHAIDAVLMPPDRASFQFLDDFEAANAAIDAPIANYSFFVAAFDAGNFSYSYGPFPAKVGNEQVSNISDEAGGDQGAQVLNIFSDYSNTDHANGVDLEVSFFREFTILESDSGSYRFEVDAKRPSNPDAAISAPSSAAIFIKLLDPNNGFQTVFEDYADTTEISSDTFAPVGIDFTIDGAAQAGLLIQFGFTNTVTDYRPSGVLYDNARVIRN